MEAFIVELVKNFILRQAIKYGNSIDWALVKVDAVKRIADLLPGEKFDREAQLIVGVIIDLVGEFFVRTGQVLTTQTLSAALAEAVQKRDKRLASLALAAVPA